MEDSTAKPKDQSRDFAFYYPGHLWYSGDWIKNLSLFLMGLHYSSQTIRNMSQNFLIRS
jgi:hypothetical protein